MNVDIRKIVLGIMVFCSYAGLAQLEMNKESKLYEIHNPELLSVDKAGSYELINRFYYWGLEEFKDVKHSVERDDTNFRGVIFHVTMPLVDNHYGVKYTHTKRKVGFDLRFDAEKKDYSYWINHITYETVEVDRKGRTEEFNGKLEEFKGAAKRGLIEELDMTFDVIIDSFTVAAYDDLTDAQMEEFDQWKDTRDKARDAAEKAAKEAAKAAAAEEKRLAKEKAAAEKAAAKEAARKAKEADKNAKEEGKEEE